MQRLIQLFFRFGGLFLFLLLEGIAFTMVVQYNKEQEAIFFNSLSHLSQFFEDKSEAISYHFSLEEQADSLRKENSSLKQLLISLDIDYTDKEVSVFDDAPFQQYILQSAKILKNSVHKNHNYLILDRGTEDGIEKHSAVITDNGIVGIVIEVRKRHCLVMSILHNETRISSALKNKNAHGSLVWNDTDPLKMNLENVPKHIQPIERGDTVITSGYSAMFPEGLMVGTVDSAWIEQGKGAHTISVNLSEDISTLKYVYIVTNLMRAEQLEFEQIIDDE